MTERERLAVASGGLRNGFVKWVCWSSGFDKWVRRSGFEEWVFWVSGFGLSLNKKK